jgi:hypothetical protein
MREFCFPKKVDTYIDSPAELPLSLVTGLVVLKRVVSYNLFRKFLNRFKYQKRI